MNYDSELKRHAANLYDLATEARTVKNPVELIALLLLLKKENLLLFPTLDHPLGNKYNEDIEDEIRSAIYNLDSHTLRTHLLSVSESVKEYSRESIIDMINYLEYHVTNNDYGYLLDEIIFYAANSGDKTIIEGVQPREITQLVTGLTKEYNIEAIYNPFAGIGSFYTAFTNSVLTCLSQEVNHSIWGMGAIRCCLYDISLNKYTNNDSISNWGIDQHYDLIVTFPPLNYPISRRHRNDEQIKYVDDFVMKNIVQLHNHDSIFIGLFSTSFLSRQFNASKWFRSYIIDHDILESVIILPSNILYGTSASTTLIIINTNKQDREKIKFVDGTQYYEKKGKLNILETYNLLEAIKANNIENVKIAHTSEIREQDYILDAKRYFYQEDDNLEQYKIRTLKELLKPLKEDKLKSNENKQAKIVKFSNLKDSIANYTITYEGLSSGKVQKEYQKIYRDSILLSSRFGELRPTYIKVNDYDDVYHINGIRAFELKKTSDITLEYLIYYLSSKSVKEYVRAYSVGTTIQFLSYKDLENIKIPIPSLKQQEKILSAVQKTYQAGRKKESELEKYIQEKKQEYIEELRIKKHSLSQHFSNFDASIKTLYTYLKKHDNVSIDDYIGKKQQITIECHLENMIRSSKHVGELIDKLTNNTEFEPSREINIDRFLSDYVKAYPTNDKFEFIYSRDDDSLVVESDDGQMTAINPLISISSKELSSALEDIVSNAQIHGFTDANKRYIIRVKLSYEPLSNALRINIENNGNSLPEGLDEKRYKTKNEIAGKTGRSGLGGYHCSQIIEHYNGQITLIKNELSEFSVLLSIELPLIKK